MYNLNDVCRYQPPPKKRSYYDETCFRYYPAYNVGKYIGATLRSLQGQTWQNWEALVVDDGSTDNTANKIRAAAAADSRIRLIQQANGGSSAARNAGLDAASGDYAAFIDGDDKWHPTLLETLAAAKEKAGAGFAYCGYTHVYDSGFKRGFRHPYPDGDILLPVAAAKTHIQIGCTLTTGRCLSKTEYVLPKAADRTGSRIHHQNSRLDRCRCRAAQLLDYRIRGGSAIHAKWNWQKHIHAIFGVRRAQDFALAVRRAAKNWPELKKVFEQRIAAQWLRFCCA
jgi:UDP-glucose:(glucosyl)LPS beta-1,3-glucosyltransferase